MNPSIVSITLLSPGSGRHRASALGVLLALAAGSGQAQTIPAATIDEPLLGGCRASLAQSPEQARVLAERILAREALPAALEIGAIGCMAQAQRRLGEAGNADATTQRLLHALDNPLLARNARQAGLREAAELLQWNGQYSASVHLLEQMREEATGAHDVNGEIDALLSLALLRGQQLGDPEGALLYLQRALALTDPDRRPPTVSELLLHYHHGHTLLALQRRQEARKALRQAAAIALRLPDQQHIAQRIESDNAEIARAEGSTGQAQARLLAVARWQQEHDPQGHVSTLQRLALIQLDLGQADAALALATQAQLLAEQAYYRDELRRGLELMADIHAARGDHASARDYARRGRDMDRDSIRGEGLNALAALQSTIEQPALAGPGSDDPQLRRVRHMRDAAIAACAVLLLVAVSLLVGNQRRRRQLRRLKRIDPLTGLLNRRELERVVAARPHTAADPRSAIVLLDIDSFRQINERCGHPAGDRVLAAVAQRLREACDPDDLIARWDGEEFLIVRHDTTRAAAFALADQLRACVERLQVDTGDAPLLPLSAAVGVAPLALSARQPARLQDGLRLAEHALAIAKRSGSNAWAGIWGSDSGEQVDMLEVIRDPGQALVQRWIVVDANRPAAWETLRATHLKTSTFGGTEVPLGS